jgi:hypothetical protein
MLHQFYKVVEAICNWIVMRKSVRSALKGKDSDLDGGFIAFPSIGASSLFSLLEYPYNYLIVLIPILIFEGFLIVFFLLRLRKKYQSKALAAEKTLPGQQPEIEIKPKGLFVTKAEVVGDSVKFSVKKGFLRKHWVTIEEIPVYEIGDIENSGDKLSVTWKGATHLFVASKKAQLFWKLRDQVKAMIEEHQKTLEFNEKSALRKSELLWMINDSIRIVDLSFDVLMGLQGKRIDWERLVVYCDGLGEKVSFVGKTLPPFDLDFSNISAAVKDESPREVSEQTWEILKSIEGYFSGLNLDEDIKGTVPNFQNAKNAISAYYTLNDLLLGKLVGDKQNLKENSYLEMLLQELAKETKINVDFGSLIGSVNRIGSDVDRDVVVEDTRDIFKEQLKNIDQAVEQPSTEQILVPQQGAVPMQADLTKSDAEGKALEPQAKVPQQEPVPMQADLTKSDAEGKALEPQAKKNSVLQRLWKRIHR